MNYVSAPTECQQARSAAAVAAAPQQRYSNDLVHPIVLWVVTNWSKVNTTATTTAGALMRDATKWRLYIATQRLSCADVNQCEH